MLGDRTLNQRVAELLTNAVAVLAVGNCASYGGLIADKVLRPPQNLIKSWT
jgi:hydrogenase small subunit